MPRNIPLQNKIESFIVEADRHVNAVGLSVVGSRNSDRNIQETSPAPSAGPYSASPTHEQPFRSGNGQYPERQDSSYQPSSGYQYSPPHQQQQPSQGSVIPLRTSPSSQQVGSSESGGQSLGVPVVDGRRRDASFSESSAGPSRFQDQPPSSQWQQQQQQQQPTSSQWQNSYQQYPVHMRPPTESAYPPQDPPSQGGRNHPTSESSYPTGPQWQNKPVIMRPPGSSDGYPSSQSGSNLNGNSSYSAGPSHTMQSPPRPPVSSDPGYPPSQGGGNLNGNSSYSAGPSHVQNPPRPPIPSFPSQGGSSQNGGNSSYSSGPSHLQSTTSDRYPSHDQPPSHWQNHPSDRFPMGPPPLQPPLHPGNSLHAQGPINTGPSNSSQAPPLDIRQRTGGSSYSESTNSQWNSSPSRFSGGSETTAATTEGMTRAREGSFNSQQMNSWDGSGHGHPDDSPPAYVLMGHPGSVVPDTGL
jgi:hypothetical protein